MPVAPGAPLDLVPAGCCPLPSPRPRSDRAARSGTPAGTVWAVRWEVSRTDGRTDVADLIVRLEALP